MISFAYSLANVYTGWKRTKAQSNICAYTYLHTRIFIYMYLYVCVYIHVHLLFAFKKVKHTNLKIPTPVSTLIHVCMYAYLHSHAFVCMHVVSNCVRKSKALSAFPYSKSHWSLSNFQPWFFERGREGN